MNTFKAFLQRTFLIIASIGLLLSCEQDEPKTKSIPEGMWSGFILSDKTEKGNINMLFKANHRLDISLTEQSGRHRDITNVKYIFESKTFTFDFEDKEVSNKNFAPSWFVSKYTSNHIILERGAGSKDGHWTIELFLQQPQS